MQRDLKRLLVGLELLVKRLEHVDRCAYISLGFFGSCNDVDMFSASCSSSIDSGLQDIGCAVFGEGVAYISLAEVAQHTLAVTVLVAVKTEDEGDVAAVGLIELSIFDVVDDIAREQLSVGVNAFKDNHMVGMLEVMLDHAAREACDDGVEGK